MDIVIDEVDKDIIRVLQEDFPITKEPYKELSEKIGVTEEEFIERLKKLKEAGALRKMGAVLKHPKVGFSANVLVAWEVSAEKLQEVGKKMSLRKEVTHCYDRNTAANWNYNLYTMIHGKSREECEKIIDELKSENFLKTNPILLYSKKEWKKTGMRYFTD